MSEEKSSPADEKVMAQEKYRTTEKWTRRIGFVFLFATGFIIFVPMVIGAIQGVRYDQISDPLTGVQVTAEDHELDCYAESGNLIYLAGKNDEMDSTWEQRYRRWVTRCNEEHGELYRVMQQSRERLRGADSPELESGFPDEE